ncbi:MAG: hypothetical protein JO257_13860 [Deltaproteobacteria bacterium]|nr:hypothetical protein [Deltaproteobacteria bacterium]
MATSNFDPCVAGFPAAGSALDTSVMSPIIETDAPSCAYAMTSGGMACLLHVSSIRIAAGHPFGATGKLPLILVSDGPVVIEDGLLIGANGQGHGGCTARQGTTGTMWGGGGGGGGFGHAGADGGQNDTGSANPGGSANGPDTLVPLEGGCQGGDGGIGNDPTGSAAGGAGGGALEISSRVSISMANTALVLAPGGGGTGGMRTRGGGGGGAGGAILLEAPDLALGGAICAPGGGGGQGALPTGAARNGGTSTTQCVPGASSSGNQGPGGVGGLAATQLPTVGGAGSAGANGWGGGGGGGGYGHIHFHTVNAPTGSATVKPPAS